MAKIVIGERWLKDTTETMAAILRCELVPNGIEAAMEVLEGKLRNKRIPVKRKQKKED